MDDVRDTSSVSLVEVKQNNTMFEAGTDYKKPGDKVDWSPSGNEPASGSTYSVTYDYIAALEPENMDADGFDVSGAVAGSSILLTYQQALPRLDRLCITQEGTFQWLKGVASESGPRSPAVPSALLPIATVYQTWRNTREVASDAVRVVAFSEFTAINRRMDYVLQEVARQRLEADVFTREAGARVGLFVDPLLDDSMRDQGIEQNAAVVAGELTLSIAPTVLALASPASAPAVPAFNAATVLEQTLRTGSMLVNPYNAFGILPPKVLLQPAVDQWTEVETQWKSPVTERFDILVYAPNDPRHGQTLTSTSSSTQVLSTTNKPLEFLREINVAFTISGFGPQEVLQKVTFDGVDAQFTPATANSDGALSGSFTIPTGIPAGAKTVIFSGAEGGSVGSAQFIGQGNLTVQEMRQVNTVTATHIDPLAQTFVLNADTQMCGVDLWFTAKGGEVRVQLREVSNGVPTRTILAEASVLPSQIVTTGQPTRINFPVLVQLVAGTEYAVVVLCNDAETALAIAEMGKFDSNSQRWVTAQPYTVGVLLSSSNASTWTAHQDRDLAFRLLAANFSTGNLDVM